MEYLSSGVGGPGGVKGMATWRVSEKSLRPALWGGGGRGVMLFPPPPFHTEPCLSAFDSRVLGCGLQWGKLHSPTAPMVQKRGRE